jgi:hypothetical protein
MKIAKLETSGWVEWELDEKDAENLRVTLHSGLPIFVRLTEFDARDPRRSKKNCAYFDGVDMIGDEYETSKSNDWHSNDEEDEEESSKIPPNCFVFTLPVDKLDVERLIELKCSKEEHLALGNSLFFNEFDHPIWMIRNDSDNEVFRKHRGKAGK